jgi:hypothetical protein
LRLGFILILILRLHASLERKMDRVNRVGVGVRPGEPV